MQPVLLKGKHGDLHGLCSGSVLTGAGATALIDIWAIVRKRLLGIPALEALLAVWGLEWMRHPTLAPALLVGIVSVAAPFFLLQPGMGAGVAARRTARPNAARLQTLLTHAVFGLGLYGAAWVASWLYVG